MSLTLCYGSHNVAEVVISVESLARVTNELWFLCCIRFAFTCGSLASFMRNVFQVHKRGLRGACKLSTDRNATEEQITEVLYISPQHEELTSIEEIYA